MTIKNHKLIIGVVLIITFLGGLSAWLLRDDRLVPKPTDIYPAELRVLAQSPYPGEELPLDGSIELYFSLPVDQESVRTGLRVSPPLAANLLWLDEASLRIVAQPGALRRNVTYTVTIDTSVRSTDNQVLAEPVALAFKTPGYLEVKEVVPAPDTNGVDTEAVVTVFFNRPVVPLVIAEEMGDLPQPLTITPSVAGRGEWLNTSIYTWKPDRPLAGGETYTVAIPNGLLDQSGATLRSDYQWTFTVRPPTIVSIEPGPGAVDVSSNTSVTVTFEQPMDQASSQSAFSLIEPTARQAVGGAFTWNEDSTVMTFTPGTPLVRETRYVVSVSDAALAANREAPLSGSRTSDFTTLPLPQVLEVDYSEWGNEVVITFNIAMDEATLTNDRVTISPELPGGIELDYFAYSLDYSYLRVAGDFQLNTQYTLTLLPGAADPEGYTIGQPYTYTFTPTERRYEVLQLNASSWETPPFDLYDASRPVRAVVLHRGYSSLDFELYRLPPDALAKGWPRRAGGELIRSWSIAADANQHDIAVERVTLGMGDGLLSPGAYILVLDAPGFRDWSGEDGDIEAAMFVVTANITLKNGPRESLAWLTDLSNGQPIAGKDVAFYTCGDSFSTLVGQARTGRDGLASVTTDLNANLPWTPWYGGAKSFAVVNDGETYAVGSTLWSAGIKPSDFGVRESNAQTRSVYVYTDRPIYRPGQEVFFKAVLRDKNDMTYAPPSDEETHVQVSHGDKAVYSKSLTIDDSGVVEGSFTLPEDAELGVYSVSVDFADHPDDYFFWYYYGEVGYREGLTSFTVAEYRKPEIEVTVTPQQTQVMNGEAVSVVVDATYYFGGPAANVSVRWRAFEYPGSFDYEGPGRYSFYSGRSIDYDYYGFYYGFDDSFYPEKAYASGEGHTDENGQLAITFPARLADGAGPSRFMIEATVEEAAGLPVSGRASVWAHAARYYAGVEVERCIGSEGQELPIEVIVVDWDSQPVRGRTVSVQLLDREWVYENYKDELGQTRSRWSVRETPVGDPIYGVTKEGGIASLAIVPPRSGSYSVRATVTDPAGNRSSGSHRLWVWGDEPISEPDYDEDNQMEVAVDRDSYASGDQATILINSPFSVPAQALVTIERGSILSRSVITLPAGASAYTLPITADYAPNIYFSIVAVAPADPVADFRMGLAKLTITPVEQTLQVIATPLQEFAEPGTQARYRIEVKDYAGKPVEADLSLALVDKAVLALAELENGSILEAFYREQPENIFTSVSLTGMVERQLFELLAQEGGGAGGGGGKGGPETIPLSPEDARSQFKDTAYWRASIHTNARGLAEVTIPLPDNLTTWRLDARAVTLDTRVGQTTVDIIATRPLLIRPITPRFFVARDEATIGAIVNNNTQQDLEVVVMVAGSGVTFTGALAQQGTIPSNGAVQVNWPMIVNPDAQWVDLTFSVQSGDLKDASKPPLGDPANGRQLPVYTYEVPETVGTAGQMIVPGTRIEGLMLPTSMGISEGQVRVQIDPSLAAATIDSLDWLKHYRHECIEQTLSRVMPNAVTLRALQTLEVRKPELEPLLRGQINLGLTRIYDKQLSSGAWGWFDEIPNPMVTAYAIHTLVEVSEAGVEVKPNVLSRAVSYLRRELGSVEGLEATSRLNRQAYFLFVLAKAGSYEQEKVDELFEEDYKLSNWARAMLAQTIWMNNPSDPRLDTLRSDLVNTAILSATGAHWEDGHDYYTWTTNTRTTAMVLDTLVLLWPDSDLIPNATRWLMVARKADHWETTQETAWAIIALTDTMQSSGELKADYTWLLSLNDETIGTGRADAQTLTDSRVVTVDVADLLAGQVNRLAFQHSTGPGRLYYTTHLTAWLPVERVKALDRGISINRRYLNTEGIPVMSGQAGETLRVEVTLVTDRSLNYAAVEDYYPAGAEAVDATLLTESESSVRPSLSRVDDPLDWGWGWWYLDKAELRDERAVFYAEYLPAGTYQFVYQIRLVVPGMFRVIPPTAWEFYFPEVYGRGDGMLFEIKPAAQ